MVTRRGFLAGSSAAIIAGAAPRIAWGRTEVDVAIIGAGLAGLNAARMCEAAGLKVVVIEAENRVGGRLFTLDDMSGRPEAGGIQIGAGYARLHAIAGELGVELSDGASTGAGGAESNGNLYAIGGMTSTAPSWPESPANRLPENERQTEPAALLRHYSRALPDLVGPQDWLDASSDHDISVAQALHNAGASEEARRLIAANFNGNSLAGMSQLHLARSLAIFRSQPGPISTVAGGSQRLPEAMAARLGGEMRLGTRVEGIFARDRGVSLLLSPSGNALRARQAICTIPFSALRSVPVHSAMSPHMAHAMAQLPYTRASFAYLAATEPFWLHDGYPDTLWTDDPLIGRVFALSDGSADAPPRLKLWTTGAGADLLDRMAPEDAGNAIVKRIETMRPSARGKCKVERLFSWQRMAGARGIYHHIGTGMARHLATACREAGTDLHFAGEHLAIASSGMEGALESGERAAQRVIARA
ncbi:NAD(P)/FAD-dependent oxidoreductase [Erythrobacter sp. JK5]|uniref:flavin monoamine oxidase family protein n=1 Tax=Erythrobacter sp. JK5 TaxID=2829500 RepID=UPI001BACAB42|nr:NAD(P)/FAD-dependent oxidoreductase [Erythrobacter sp. JK5]QUL36972.1 FAD-dependent oxidoreductase [Erythrobacter sp. JK5]